ncbi:histidine-rich glycoprotein-like isoform X2 [Zophobas morio]|uniref:histidine-rich glycoprotein-like isoform X2 n=1 Tax=Zophobas morio TaxID=2755281 RepID=UPI0030832272
MAEETHNDHCDHRHRHHQPPRFFQMMMNRSRERYTDQDDCRPSCFAECPSGVNLPPIFNHHEGPHGPHHRRHGPCRFSRFDEHHGHGWHHWHHGRFGHHDHSGPFENHQHFGFGHHHHWHHGPFEHGHGRHGHQCRHQRENPTPCH